MNSGSRSHRRTILALSVTLLLAACGGGSDDNRTESAGESGQAGVVATASEVESAVVETTTPVPGDGPDVTSETTVAESTTTSTTTTTTTTTTSTTVAPATTTTTTTAAPVPTNQSGDAPEGYSPIVDDSGEVRANVPSRWVQTDGAPEGELRQLAAAPDLPGFLAGYTKVGMILITGAAATPDSWMDGLATTLGIAETDGCTISETSEYSDGVYTGTEHVLSCGDPATVTHLIGGRNSDGDLFFLLAIVRPVDNIDVRNQIVQSFFID
ncbi:MAG: hypothetical protein ABJH68_20025 [Ilumatobacter sp.]|uniref:hypothetical protein n=1 Tax=Ilumatobacter sp. TaxID=1967498 RepID=UPI003299686D